MRRLTGGAIGLSLQGNPNRTTRRTRNTPRLLNACTSRECHAHTTVTTHLGLPEQTKFAYPGTASASSNPSKRTSFECPDTSSAHDAAGPSCSIAGMGKPSSARACSANSLRSCETIVTSPRVMRARRHFAEEHVVSFHKQLNAKYTATTKCICHRARDLLRALDCARRHGMRLPRLAIISVNLHVADWCAERCALTVSHREQSDFIIKINKAFNDHSPTTRPAPLLRVVPRLVHVGGRTHHALPLAR